MEVAIDLSDRSVFNPKYIPMMYDTRRYHFLMGGGGSGKSTYAAQNEILKSYEAKQRLLCIRKVKDTCKDSVFAELMSVIERWDLVDDFIITKSPLHITNRHTGSDMIFRGMDKSEKLKSIHRVTRVWCEEATELSKEDFNQIDLRLRGVANPQIVCTFNPIDQDSWINTEFWQFGDTDKVKLLHTTFLDNKFVGEEYSAVMDRLKIQNPRMYEIYALGLWGQALEGVIFKYDDIQKVPEEAKLLCRGMDFGFTNDPTALIAIYLWNGKIILDEELYKRQMTNQDLIRFFEDIGLSRSEQIRADSSEPKSIEEIHRAGYNIVGATKGKDSINFGIDTMKQYDILITARSQNLKKEFKNYCWAQDKNGKMLNTPIDDFNHAIDGVRYGFELLAKKREIFTY